MTNSFFNFQASEPSLYTLLKQTEINAAEKINCLKIGIIEEVKDGNIVKCLIANKKLMGTNPNGSAIWRDYPPIYARLYYVGSGECYINYPVIKNQLCLLFFADKEIESIFATGEVSTLTSTRAHSLTDCLCLPLSQYAPGNTLKINGNNININSAGNVAITSSALGITAKTNINGDTTVTGTMYADIVKAGNGASGAFISKDDKTITVSNGIITSIG